MSRWKALAVFLAACALTSLQQFASGRFRDDFSGSPDEPAHFVSSVMIRQYLLDGPLQSPIAFAEDYYAHYPKVGLGHWPPLFHLSLGAWMTVVGTERYAALLFLALLTGLVSLLLFAGLRGRVQSGTAMAAALLFPLLPMVQQHNRVVMTEIAGALTLFGAILAFVRFLEHRTHRDALLFALLGVAAIYTRQSGWQLVFVPPLAILFSRAWGVVRLPSLWLSAGAVALACLPFYLFYWDAIADGSRMDLFGFPFLVAAFPHFLSALPRLLGWPLLLLSLIAVAVRRPWSKSHDAPEFWSNMTAGAAAALLFVLLVPASFDPRHLFNLLAPALALAALGAETIGEWAGRLAPSMRMKWWVPPAVLLLAPVFLNSPQAASREVMLKAAAFLWSQPGDDWSPVYLVSGSASAEGRFIAEFASHCPRPRRVILRATQHLAESNWLGSQYRLRHTERSALERALADNYVGAVILHEEPPPQTPFPHERLLREAIEREGSVWQPVFALEAPWRPGEPGMERVTIYRRSGPLKERPKEIRIDLRRKLGRMITVPLDDGAEE